VLQSALHFKTAVMKRNILLGAAFISLLIGCKTKEDNSYNIVNLNGNKITILGHGGLGISGLAQYPLDTYEGICMAITKGADGSEIDVQITKDSVLVAYHDGTLQEQTNHSGHIYERNWDEISDAVYMNGLYSNYHLWSMDDIFAHLSPAGRNFTFDIKFYNPDQSPQNRDIFHRAILRIVSKYHLEDNITIESPDEDFLATLKAKNNNLRLFIYTEYDSAMAIAQRNGFTGITVDAEEVTVEKVKAAHDKGLMVVVFGVNAVNHDETIRKNVDIMQTDMVSDLVFRLKGQHESLWDTSPF